MLPKLLQLAWWLPLRFTLNITAKIVNIQPEPSTITNP